MMTSKTSLILLITIAAWATVGTAYGQNLIGSSGAGWQTWKPGIDLNDNGAPYWDNSWGSSTAGKNVGFCLTSTGVCQGIGSTLEAPGALPFWGMPYNSGTDTGGARDNKVYFKNNIGTLSATLYLNASANPSDINEFGWFETNSTGTLNGNKHVLFEGSGFPPGTLTPSPIGTTVNFRPTQYFGYYFSDVGDPETLNGPEHGCYAYTIFAFNDEDCTAAGPGQGDHDFVVFREGKSSVQPKFWVVGEDPANCVTVDPDCNLTIVRVTPVAVNN